MNWGRKISTTLLAMTICTMALTGPAGAEKSADKIDTPAASAAVLLEKGIFNEETAGDLDAAMTIYKQIVADAAAARPAVAEAQYRLAMCLLKKGDKPAAAEQLRKLLADYSDQKNLAAKAQTELTKLAPPQSSASMVFGETIETTLPVIAKRRAEVLDLDTGKRMVMETFGENDRQTHQWIRENHLDLVAFTEKGIFGLFALDTAVLPVSATQWDSLTPQQLIGNKLLAQMEPDNITPIVPADATEPATGLFRTREGAMGVLQLLGPGDDEKSVKIRYKLLQSAGPLFPEALGARVVEPVAMKLVPVAEAYATMPPQATICQYDLPKLQWTMAPEVAAKAKFLTILVAPITMPQNGYEANEDYCWVVANVPAEPQGEIVYGKAAKGYTVTEAKELKPDIYTVIIAAYETPQYDKNMEAIIGTAVAQITVQPLVYTQAQYYDIAPDGMLQFKSIQNQPNTSHETITEDWFRNSDFVQVEKMYDGDGKELLFDVSHNGSHYQYRVALNKPVEPGEPILMSTQGTMNGRLKRDGDEFTYYMRHFPGGPQTRRIEVYTLPAGAELLQTTPDDMARRTHDGRIQLYVEKMIPPRGSITTAFKYRLSAGDEILKAKMINWVEDFFSKNYRDITARKTIEWGQPEKTPDGNLAIRYKFLATILNKDLKILEKRFTFTPEGKYLSAETLESRPADESVTPPNAEPTDADKREAEGFSADGWRLWRERKFSEAEEKFQAAVKTDPSNANAWNGLGWAQFNQGKPLNAKAAFETAVEIDPKAAASWNGLGWIAKNDGDHMSAIMYWKEAVKANPGTTAALSGLAQTYMERGNYQAAFGHYRQWLKVEPDSTDARAGLEKVRTRQKAVEAATNTAEAWLQIVDAEMYDESWQRAATFFRNNVSQRAWKQSMEAVREPLGKVTSRELISATYTTSAPGAPDGQYVIIQYKTTFENKADAVETVTPMMDDGQWRISGYFIK